MNVEKKYIMLSISFFLSPFISSCVCCSPTGGEWGSWKQDGSRSWWMEKRGAVLIMAPHIPESERSAWRPWAADSSCISWPSEDGGGGGGDGKWRGQWRGRQGWEWDGDVRGDLVIIWHSSSPFITSDNASHVGAGGNREVSWGMRRGGLLF